ncbi:MULTISPECIES: hypothetical protein [unclassified Bradyrhizobium]
MIDSRITELLSRDQEFPQFLLVIPDKNRGRKHRNTCAHGAAVFHAQQRAPIERGCITARLLAREPAFEGFNSVVDQLADILEVFEKLFCRKFRAIQKRDNSTRAALTHNTRTAAIVA